MRQAAGRLDRIPEHLVDLGRVFLHPQIPSGPTGQDAHMELRGGKLLLQIVVQNLGQALASRSSACDSSSASF